MSDEPTKQSKGGHMKKQANSNQKAQVKKPKIAKVNFSLMYSGKSV